uniref:Uncharacterized protein n=1 Tax=Vespula pensylvanica TaxID=30213 RepID=A0A834UBZ1_VESPE|nr:hypothetical protein H0235_005800 [Vespula pensylvanica]
MKLLCDERHRIERSGGKKAGWYAHERPFSSEVTAATEALVRFELSVPPSHFPSRSLPTIPLSPPSTPSSRPAPLRRQPNPPGSWHERAKGRTARLE